MSTVATAREVSFRVAPKRLAGCAGLRSLLAFLLVAAWGHASAEGAFEPAGAGLPTISISVPADGASYRSGEAIRMEAQASDSDGAIVEVVFFQNGNRLGGVTNEPWVWVWSGPPPGIYALTASATDDSGASQVSAPVTVFVGAEEELGTNALVELGSVWKYLDDGSDQGTEWSLPGFDDSGWAEGPAQLGYGDGDEATVVSYGPNAGDKYPTTYFRHAFTVDDPDRVLQLSLDLLRDDGAVAYLNGMEVFRLSLGPGPVTYDTYANTQSEYGFESMEVDPALLVPGLNVMAVEIHQGNPGSSDISFDMELLGVYEAATNNRPLVSLTSPVDGIIVAAPGNLTLAAVASDSDGGVANVAFYADDVKLTDDMEAPYSYEWSGVPAGNYALTAVATDGVNLVRTSSVVNVTVSTDAAPPVVVGRVPEAGTVTELTALDVTFSKDVAGVDASDLLVAGIPATAVTGGGARYTFTFDEPAFGVVPITWVPGHGIADLFTPANPFDELGPGATWQYEFLDIREPRVTLITPVPGSIVAALTTVEVIFDEVVLGTEAGDLLVNGGAAATLSGVGAGPYSFGFAQPAEGTVMLQWASGHGIADVAGNPFTGGGWSYQLDTNVSGVVISEIMYHPSSENVLEEFIELHNKGASPVNLLGWRFSDGVDFVFPDVEIAAGGFLVVAADLAVFQGKYPGVENVVGNWTGQLSNRGEDIDLDDAEGRRVDSVTYADEGDWAVRVRGELDRGYRGWDWFKEHDGEGKSLELINPGLSNNSGQNWAASLVEQGTPGGGNSVLENNIPPMILEAVHRPLLPSSADAVLVSARVVDESGADVTVELHHRVADDAPESFQTTFMSDDGTGADEVANDGIFSAWVPARADRSVVEYFIAASDAQGNRRTWPAAARQEDGTFAQTANALYQVDDTVYTGAQPVYKLVLTELERQELASIPRNSTLQGPNSQMNGSFISVDGTGTQLRYLVGIRNRGHGSRGANPPNYRVNFRGDDLWKGVEAINLNTRNVHVQHLGSVLARKAGAAGGNTIAVQVRVNGVNLADGGSPMFGSYAAVEVSNADWARNHFPFDSDGNVYRAVRDIAPPDFSYRGEDSSAYTNTWFKASNVSEDDWTDLIGMLRVVGSGNTEEFTTANVERVVNVDQWLTHLAVMNLFGNAESGLNGGYNDDYYMYRGVEDPRFMLTYWDLDQILGVNSFNPGADIFSATANNGSGAAMGRLLHWPDFEPRYFRELNTLVQTVFAEAEFERLVDQTLESYVPANVRDAIKNWMATRRASVLSQLGGFPEAAPIASLLGTPRSPTPSTDATLRVGGLGVTHYRFALNGGSYGGETDVTAPVLLSGLTPGETVVSVIGRNADGVWQDEAAATVRAWVVDPAWPAVELSEVLARNVTAMEVAGTHPDLIELRNPGATDADLSGMRLSDSLQSPGKFTFPQGTILGGGQLLVLSEHDLGFALNQDGEGVYLFAGSASGGSLLDQVEFGLQLADLSISRLSGGDWELSLPTLGQANQRRATGDARALKLNEWLAFPLPPFADDFIEIYNPASEPVAIGGLHLTDQPIGAPRRHRIPELSFMGAGAVRVFVADGEDATDHVGFRLSAEQGELGLFDEHARVIDCVTYGPQQAGVARGRCPDGGFVQTELIVPTPGALNACPFVPPPPTRVELISLEHTWRYDDSGTDLGIEWRAPEFDDSGWLSGPATLGFDTDPIPDPIETEIPLAGQVTFYFRTTFVVGEEASFNGVELTHLVDDGAVFYLDGLELAERFNMPGGDIDYLTLTGPSVGVASFRTISIDPALLPPGPHVLAVEVHQSSPGSSDMVFNLGLEGIIVTNTPSQAGIVMNEVLADNGSLREPDGSTPDWVEIYNPSSNAVDLAGMSLTDDLALPRRWIFPPGSILLAQDFLRVRFDGDLPSAATNSGFGLRSTGGAVYLFNRPADGGALLDAVSYGLQAADWSLGRVPDGSGDWTLTLPSLGSPNIGVTLGDPTLLRVNEWMADPASGEDWFELYNPNQQPTALGGLHVSDDLGDPTQHAIAARSYIGVGNLAFQKFVADDQPGDGADHVNFKLSAGGEAIVLSGPTGLAYDAVSFGAQREGISEGRLPDGEDSFAAFPGTATPGRSNFLPLPGLFINELLSHSDPPLEDAVEVYNASGDDMDISGWYLSDSQRNLRKFQIPPGTVVPAGGFVVLYEGEFNGDHPGEPFSFSSAEGDEAYLSEVVGQNLTGFRGAAEFGPSENGVSFGRFETSVGVDFVAMSARTFGVDEPASTNEFRMGTGAPNAYPKVGPLVISEIHYHPPGTNDHLEFVEIQNITSETVPLFDPAHPANVWRLRDAVRYDFPAGLEIPPGGFLVVVSFDPDLRPDLRSSFEGMLGGGSRLVGPYSGQLDNAGDRVELLKPDAPQLSGGVPYVLVERVVYDDAAPWPVTADGEGDSLQRMDAALYGNDPGNWRAGVPAPGPGGLWIDRILLTGPGQVALEFTVEAGATYTVQYREFVDGGVWQKLVDVPAAEQSQTVVVPDELEGGQRFYRLVTPASP